MVRGLKIKCSIAFVLFLVTGYLLFLDKSDVHTFNISESNKELFNPNLKRLNSIEKMLNYTDSVYSSKNLAVFDTSIYVKVVSGTVKRRFYHGLSSYSLSRNWICYVFGELFWSHMSAIVIPDDILQFSEGLCSQQNIVFLEVLKKKGITTRTVGLGTKEGPGHFLSEVRFDNKWHLYDVDLEPNWKATVFSHSSLAFLVEKKEELYKIYEGRMPIDVLDKITKKITYGLPNEFPAKKMLAFQYTMLLLTYFLPLCFFVIFIYYFLRVQKSNKKIIAVEEELKNHELNFYN